MRFAIYKRDTGLITQICVTPIQREVESILASDESCVQVRDNVTNNGFYVPDGGARPRPAQQTVLTGRVLSKLPVPCTIYINRVPYECQDDTAELAFDQPGSYTVRVQAWPYLDKEFTIENPA